MKVFKNKTNTTDLRKILAEKAQKDKEIERMKANLTDISKGNKGYTKPTVGNAIISGAKTVGGKINKYAVHVAKAQQSRGTDFWGEPISKPKKKQLKRNKDKYDPFDSMY